MNLLRHSVPACRLRHSRCEAPELPGTNNACTQPLKCYASPGRYPEQVQESASTGQLKPPKHNLQRQQDTARRDSNSSASTSGTSVSRAQSSERSKPLARRWSHHPNTQGLQQQEWQLLDPDLQQQRLETEERQVAKLEAQVSACSTVLCSITCSFDLQHLVNMLLLPNRKTGRHPFREQHRSSLHVVCLANSIFKRLLETFNTSQGTQLEQLGQDLVLLLPPPALKSKPGLQMACAQQNSYSAFLSSASIHSITPQYLLDAAAPWCYCHSAFSLFAGSYCVQNHTNLAHTAFQLGDTVGLCVQ